MYYFYDYINDALWNIRNWFTRCIYGNNLQNDEYDLSNEYFTRYDEIWDL